MLGVLLLLAAAPVRAQLPQIDPGGVGMGHLHLLVSEADYDEHRRAWIEGLGARAEKLGPLEALLLPGVVVVLKKGELRLRTEDRERAWADAKAADTKAADAKAAEGKASADGKAAAPKPADAKAGAP